MGVVSKGKQVHANETQIFATMLSDPVKALKKKKKSKNRIHFHHLWFSEDLKKKCVSWDAR